MLTIDTTGPVPQLLLYGEIAARAWYMDAGEVISAEEVLQALAELKGAPDLTVRINSVGGDVFEGVAIYQALARFEGKVRVEVDALAASIASVIAMAGDRIVVAGNAMLMIHRAWTIAMGNQEELQRVVDSLTKVDESIVNTYAARVGDKATREQLVAWMAAETWLTAQEAVERGFADEAGELKAGAVAVVPDGRYRNTPAALLVPAGSGDPRRTEGRAAGRQPAGGQASGESTGGLTPARSPRYAIAARVAALRGRLGL
jgi:ATP-dependent Clp protease protease subunit